MLKDLYDVALMMQRNVDGREYYWSLCVNEICDELFRLGKSEKIVNAVFMLAYKNK